MHYESIPWETEHDTARRTEHGALPSRAGQYVEVSQAPSEPVGQPTYMMDDKKEPSTEVNSLDSATNTSRKGWKPKSISVPALAAFIIVTVGLIGVIEVLAQRSDRNGALAAALTLDDIPQVAMWSYTYGPTIVAVIYSLIWSWIDLDVKRMQPWFELSRPEGAKASTSLNMSYPTDFLPLVPGKSLKLRQWSVFCSGTAVLLIFWVITPLSATFMGTGTIAKFETAQIQTMSQLAPVEEHVNLLDQEILHRGFAVGWLDQDMPIFTTREYAYLPFSVAEAADRPKNITWVGDTVRYSTNLKCESAKIERNAQQTGTYVFSNDNGCNINYTILAGAPFQMEYQSLLSSDNWARYLTHFWAPFERRCPESAKSDHQFLSVWVHLSTSDNEDPDVVAAFCEATYWKQRVRLSVLVEDDMRLDNVEPLAASEQLGDDEFNRTAFENLLGWGLPELEYRTPKDWAFRTAPADSVRMEDTPINSNMSFVQPPVMVSFALAGDIRPPQTYGSVDGMEEAYSRAHRYLFSLAINTLTGSENATASTENKAATVQWELTGITVSRPISIVIEVLLGIVALFAAIVLCVSHKSPSNLVTDPASISLVGDMLKADRSLLERFQAVDNTDQEKSLRDSFGDSTLKLVRGDDGQTPQAFLILVNDGAFERSDGEAAAIHNDILRTYRPVVTRPTVLKSLTGVSVLLILAIATSVLVYLKIRDFRDHGLVSPTDNFEVLQILTNYLPMIFSTMLEPLWVMLTRTLCIVQPFQDLWQGQARLRRTLSSEYTSIPPQMVLWKAIRSGHYLLFLVCVMALAANLLAVGLGAVFNLEPSLVRHDMTFEPESVPIIHQDYFQDDPGSTNTTVFVTRPYYDDTMYVVVNNITSGTPLPPWTTPDYFFMPHKLDSSHSSDANATRYTLEGVRGFGARGNCTTLESREIPVEPPETAGLNYTSSVCNDPIDVMMKSVRIVPIAMAGPPGPAAMEYSSSQREASANHTDLCESHLLVAYPRSPMGSDPNATAEASIGICRPVFETGLFDVTVDSEGRVHGYAQRGSIEHTLNYSNSSKHEKFLLDRTSSSLTSYESGGWHNDTMSRSWLSHFIVAKLGNRDFLDPSKPIPDVEKLVPTLDEVYRLVFAVYVSGLKDAFEEYDEQDAAARAQVVEGYTLVRESRIFMDSTAFIISIAILGLQMVIAATFYLRARAFALPGLPTSIGAVLAYIAPSSVLWRATPDQTYGFGRFVGPGGQVHLGIEADHLVTPVRPDSLRERRPWIERLLRSGDRA